MYCSFFVCVCVLNGTVEFLYALMLDNLRMRIEIMTQTKTPTSLCYAQSHRSLRCYVNICLEKSYESVRLTASQILHYILPQGS